MRKLLVICFALALAGCASLSIKNPFTTTTLGDVEAAYGTALSIAVGYRDACAQRLIPPSCRTIVPQVQRYGVQAQNAIVYARSFVRNNPTLDPTTAVKIASDAVSAFSSFEAQAGVK